MAEQMMEQVYQCPPTKVKNKYRACAREFSLANQFTIRTTNEDGNCFFHTLVIAGKHHNIASLINFTHTELRAQLVQYMLDHKGVLSAFFASNNNNNDKSPEEQILALSEDGVWDNNYGDTISQIAGDVFRININLFDVKEDVVKRKRIYVVNKIVIDNYPGSPTIDILRIDDGHYEFLQPAGAAAAAPAAAAAQDNSPKTKKKSPSPNKTKKRSKTPSPPKTKKRSPSPKKKSPNTTKKSLSPNKINSKTKAAYTRAMKKIAEGKNPLTKLEQNALTRMT
jgi:hypothetical protein